MNQFLYFLKPTRFGMVTDGPTLEEAETVSRHFAYLSDLTNKGVTITETNCPVVQVRSGMQVAWKNKVAVLRLLLLRREVILTNVLSLKH